MCSTKNRDDGLLSVDFGAVYDFEISNRNALMSLKKNKNRRYYIFERLNIIIKTDKGRLFLYLDPVFMFDGRSGGFLVDFYVPNLGTLEERLCWLVHDANAYAQCLDFKSTNLLLKMMTRDLSGYGSFKSSAIKKSVSLSDKWFGVPKKNDEFYNNLSKIHVTFIDNNSKILKSNINK